jgi:type IV pilus assembly protein PilC
MKFNYQIRTKEGQLQEGIVEAFSKEAALALLQREGFYVTKLEEAKPAPIYAREIKIFKGVKKSELIAFTTQLSIMFKSGIPPTEALRTLAYQSKNPNFKEKILKISEEIRGGSTLSKALAFYPEIFSSFYINLIRAGEVSGRVAESLSYLADHLEREYEFICRIRGAMIYPLLVLFVFFIVGAIAVFFVLPKLIAILKEIGGELPLLTRAVIAISDILRKGGWMIIFVFLALGVFIFRSLKTKKGKEIFDKLSLKIPIIAPLLKKIYLSRIGANLSTLISGGIPIVQALEVTSETIGNQTYKSIILKTRDEVKKGVAISSVLKGYPENISPLFIQMILIGEKTGNLSQTLMSVVELYQKEVDREIKNLLTLLEPVLIIFMGITVAFLVISILMPLYQLRGM